MENTIEQIKSLVDTLNLQNTPLMEKPSEYELKYLSTDISKGKYINQRDILMSYIKNNGFVFVEEYVDDGYSGTNFDRPAFKKMIKDIKYGLNIEMLLILMIPLHGIMLSI